MHGQTDALAGKLIGGDSLDRQYANVHHAVIRVAFQTFHIGVENGERGRKVKLLPVKGLNPARLAALLDVDFRRGQAVAPIPQMRLILSRQPVEGQEQFVKGKGLLRISHGVQPFSKGPGWFLYGPAAPCTAGVVNRSLTIAASCKVAGVRAASLWAGWLRIASPSGW